MIMSRELFPHLGVLLGQAWDPTYLASTWNVFKINMNGWQWLANHLRKCGWQGLANRLRKWWDELLLRIQLGSR